MKMMLYNIFASLGSVIVSISILVFHLIAGRIVTSVFYPWFLGYDFRLVQAIITAGGLLTHLLIALASSGHTVVQQNEGGKK